MTGPAEERPDDGAAATGDDPFVHIDLRDPSSAEAEPEPEPGADTATDDEADPTLEELLSYLRDERGFDFTAYKRPSLTRRIRKRMAEAGAVDFAGYLAMLEAHPTEFAELFDRILINVTRFRRDPEAWDYLAAHVVPDILQTADGGVVRCWSAGCASGEEPYSLAVLLCEALGEDRFREQVKIYATDADEQALSQARLGAYATSSLHEALGAETVARYFEVLDGTSTFRQDLRRTLIFGRHDLIQDPPISRIDLLLCRNTLMYLTADVQRRILANFHFALRPRGYLFLGKSEALVTRTELFRPVDLRSHVFMKQGSETPRRTLLGAASVPFRRTEAADTRHALLESAFEVHPHPQLVIDEGENLIHANRQARALFGIGTAQLRRPLRDLDVSYRPLEMRSLLSGVMTDARPVLVRDVETTLPSGAREFFDVHLVSLGAAGESHGIVVTYLPVGQYKTLRDDLERAQRDLESAYEELQSVVEELETTNEELQSTNEELETTNEELHSTNEELETMNEELQSTNEELETLNTELRVRTGDLDGVNSFLESILRSLQAGVAVLSPDLVVRAWNQQCEELWGLRADEVIGQHFLNLDIGLPADDLRPAIRESLTGSEPDAEVELEATNRRGRPIRCRVVVSPLLGNGEGAEGVMLVMTIV